MQKSFSTSMIGKEMLGLIVFTILYSGVLADHNDCHLVSFDQAAN